MPVRSTALTLPAASKRTARTVCAVMRGVVNGLSPVVLEI
jgi:hypothetical protein